MATSIAASRRCLQRHLETTLATVSRVALGAAEDNGAEPAAHAAWQDAA